MHINSISITGFRNFKSQEIKFSSGVNVLYGNNGSGKTNLLESIFVLCLGRSHRSSTDSVMIEKNMDYYRLEGEIFSEKNYEVAVAFQTGSR
ncbi:MAG: AAA family ATPase, partial [candidate division Zixibacteria bacterium]|nr:AAA family ATPase [candidate division Zixibacteria bacterium]